MCRSFLSYACVAAVSIVLLALHGKCRADEFKFVPSVGVTEEYNDNVFFSANGLRSSFITTLAPHLAVVERTERLTAQLDLGWDWLYYTRIRNLDNFDQLYQGQISYRISPQVNLNSAASFERTSRPDRMVESTGLAVNQESDRQNYSAGADVSLSEKTTGQMGYAYERVAYNGTDVSGVEGHSVNSSIIYDLTDILPLLKMRASAGFNLNHYTASTVESYSATVGLLYPLHELWGVQADVGARFTHSVFDQKSFVSNGTITTSERTNDDLGWVMSLSLNYNGELDSCRLSVTRNVQNAAGRSGSSELTAVTGEINRRFTYELSGSLAAGYYQNSSSSDQFAAQAIDETTYRVRPTLRYAFNPNLMLDGSYEYAIVRNYQADTEAERNKFLIRLTGKFSLFE